GRARRSCEVEQRALQLEIGRQPRAALEREIELRETDRGGTQLLLGELVRLPVELVRVERAPGAELGQSVGGAHATLAQSLAGVQPGGVARQRRREPGGFVTARAIRAVEDPLARLERPA